ncbi:hypothetical protein F3Y22_tig00003435pilonHSYRG00073 [Hibiscus syriacus]|uniref:Barwin domain-containing protein n=1 Tax=Hibiscus syriacus TaxID=106335 RepID=A0A6A3CRB4_HIBSY|nr:hypothetical protein F3Y22_tig00003435pilonHSYRG00073 [Hibiscus syriacus]
MNKANDAECKKYDADKPYEWHSKYYWTNIGGLGDLEQSCGKCIHVLASLMSKLIFLTTTLKRIIGPILHMPSARPTTAINPWSGAKDMDGRLTVTNTDTKDSVTVRIMDTCGGETQALVFDYETAFKPIDTDGEGRKEGHLTVDNEFVKCDGDVDSPLLIYSQ